MKEFLIQSLDWKYTVFNYIYIQFCSIYQLSLVNYMIKSNHLPFQYYNKELDDNLDKLNEKSYSLLS
jgi:hypothetical protein